MDTKKAVLKGVLTMVVVALAGFLLFNGIGRHPYQPDELEGVFRKEAAARSVSGEGEVISETYGNSITFAMQTADGKRACATYGRSMFFDKYKELEFYTGVQGEEPAENIVYAERNDTITGDSITYSVNDGAIAYQATVRFGNDIAELAVVRGISTAFLYSNGDLSSDTGENLTLGSIVLFLFMLNVRKFGMSRHWYSPLNRG